MLKVQFGSQFEFYQTINLFLDESHFQSSIKKADEDFDYMAHDLIVPLTIKDYRFLWKNDDKTNKFIIPDEDTVRLCHHKARFNNFLIDSGYSDCVPKVLDSDVEYPYIYKYCRSGGGAKSKIINNFDDQEKYESEFGRETTFKQEYIEGNQEFSFHSISVGGTVLYHTSRKFIFPTDSFVKGVYYTNYRSEILAVNPYINLFRSIIKVLKYTGTSCIDFKIKDGRPMILEMNPRFGSSLSLTINTYLSELNRLEKESK